MLAVMMEGLPFGGHRLSLLPESVLFGPHGSDWLPSKWEKLTQDTGPDAGEQSERRKGSEQLLASAGTLLLSMVLTAGVYPEQRYLRVPRLSRFHARFCKRPLCCYSSCCALEKSSLAEPERSVRRRGGEHLT